MSEQDRSTGRADSASAFLGKGTRVTGKLVLEGPGRIEGQFEGEIAAQDVLTIGEQAVVNAQLNGTSIVVHGRVTGDITARTRIELHAPSKVVGNIRTPSLVIHEGAFFEGSCAMGKDVAANLAPGQETSALRETERSTAKVTATIQAARGA